jgi:hypothetical protein
LEFVSVSAIANVQDAMRHRSSYLRDAYLQPITHRNRFLFRPRIPMDDDRRITSPRKS